MVTFTKHALKRARERELWKYVNKKKFFYDAIHIAPDLARLEKCQYVFKWEQNTIKIVTIYSVL